MKSIAHRHNVKEIQPTTSAHWKRFPGSCPSNFQEAIVLGMFVSTSGLRKKKPNYFEDPKYVQIICNLYMYIHLRYIYICIYT